METLNPSPENNPAPQQKWLPWTIGLLGAGLLGALIFGLVQYSNAVNTQLEVATLQKEVVALRDNLKTAQSSQSQTAQQVEQLRGDLTTARQTTARDLGALRSSTRRQAEAAAAAVQADAKIAEELDKHQAAQQQVSQKLEEINRTAQQNTAKLAEVSSNVGAVRSDVASTKSELDKTIADLHRVVGDMGVMSGLIATNSKELAALRALGDRDYFEFTINKTDQLQRVGDIQVKVKKVDLKRNRYTMEIVADDKKVEKKDKTVNEPVQFYVLTKARMPYELVVNEVKKNQVVGYLATPKVKATRS